MYQISSKTGVRHAIDSPMPDNDAALSMWRGRNLPTTICGRSFEPVNFYKGDDKPNPHYMCGRCFRVVH